jgi:hypothetical protein
MSRWLGALLLVTACLTATGCAAMQRSWIFSAPGVQGSQIQVTTSEAYVTQKDVWLTIRVENTSSSPVDLAFETFVLTLPDGEEVLGYVSYMDRQMQALENVLDRARRKETEEPPVQPGRSVQIQLNFHQYGRDLRRLPILRIDMAGLLVDGASSDLPALVLEAPAKAPMGEDI